MKHSFFAKLEPTDKYILICCFVLFSGNGMIVAILGSLLPLISYEHNLSNTVSGSLLSVHQAGMMIALFLFGILPFYFGRKRILLISCGFAVCGFILLIISGNPLWLIAGFLFAGLSRGSVANFCNATVSDVSGGSAGAMNFLHGVFAIGALLAPLFVMFGVGILGDSGWRIGALIMIAYLLFNMILLPKAKLVEFSKEQRHKLSYQFLKKRLVWYHIGAIFFYIAAESTVVGWLVMYFVRSDILSAQYAQILGSILWISIFAGRLTIALLGGRFSKQSILFLTTIGTTVFYVTLLLVRDVWSITLAVIGLGFFMAGIIPTVFASSGKIMKEYPMSLGVMLLIGIVAAILMPLITGILSDSFGLLAGMSAVLVALALLLLFIVLISRSKTEV